MGSFFISWDMLTHCLVAPEELLSWGYIPPTPTSTPLLKRYRSVIKRLDELGRLIDQVPNICTFQGLEGESQTYAVYIRCIEFTQNYHDAFT